MKKIEIKKQFYTIVSVAVMMTGCGQVAPDLNGQNQTNRNGQDSAGTNNVYDATQISGEQIGGNTVTIDDSKYGNSGINDGTNANGSNGKNGSKYNSSVDGFRSIYFDFGGYAIASGMDTNMRTNTKVASKASTKIKIEGNCDEFGTDEYNYALGLKRAKSVKDSLAAEGVNVSNMVLMSYGESSPVCNAPTDGCYDRNRRVDLRLVR